MENLFKYIINPLKYLMIESWLRNSNKQNKELGIKFHAEGRMRSVSIICWFQIEDVQDSQLILNVWSIDEDDVSSIESFCEIPIHWWDSSSCTLGKKEWRNRTQWGILSALELRTFCRFVYFTHILCVAYCIWCMRFCFVVIIIISD